MGKILDTKTPPKISHLLKYIGQSVVINKTVFKVYNINAVIGGVNVTLEDRDEQTLRVSSEFGSEVIDVVRFEEWIDTP